MVFELFTGYTNGSGGRKSTFWTNEENARKAAKSLMRALTKKTGGGWTKVKASELKEGFLSAWVADRGSKFFGIRTLKIEDEAGELEATANSLEQQTESEGTA